LDEFLNRVFNSPRALAVIVTVLLLAASELGNRHGRRLQAAVDEPHRGQIAAVQAAVLGLMGLLLAFTFSMAVDRYGSRRALVLEEANTIGTAWLRASLLPEAHRRPVKDLLRDYLDLRIVPAKVTRERANFAEELRRSAEIQSQLWHHAEGAARGAPNGITATFVLTLNELIDTGAARVAASRNRIPSGVWLILLVVAAVGCWTSSYAAGASRVRSLLTSVMLPLLVSVVILLIFDLTNDRFGVIRVSQQPLIDLQQSLR
jgi:hypothetical protein